MVEFSEVVEAGAVTAIEGTGGTLQAVATLRLFARAREVAGTGTDSIDAPTVDAVIAAAVERYGSEFAELLPTCRIWLNGDSAPGSTPVTDSDEVAVLPPVSGGCE